MDENAQIVKIKKLFYLQFLKSRYYVYAYNKMFYAVDGVQWKSMQCNA